MQIFKRSKGSATVESALTLPIVILTLIGMITLGVKMYERVKASAEINRAYALAILEPSMPSETVLRMRWMGVSIIGEIKDP